MLCLSLDMAVPYSAHRAINAVDPTNTWLQAHYDFLARNLL